MSIQITMDGQLLRIDQGTTILQAARQHDIYIPTLCDYPGLPAHGSCRMCIVEIQGRPNTPTACTTPAEAGMVIQTNTPRIKALRVELLQMLLADHPSSCLICPEKSHCDECMVTLHKAGVTTGCRSCPKDSQCQIQALVEKLGLLEVNYPPRYRMLKVEKNDPFFDRDYNLCVLCGRCVRQCEKLHFASSVAYTRRGAQTVVGAAFHRTHWAVDCAFCGECVEVCPTGALSEKTRKWEGQPDGDTASTCPLCSLGCPIRLLTKNDRVIGSLPDHEAGSNCLCVKGRFGITELVNHPTRLTEPQKAVGVGRRLGIAWEESIRLAAEQLSGTSPGRFEMVVSPNCSLESLYVAQKFTRQGMQSNHIHTNSLNCNPQDKGELFDLVQQSQPLSILAEASAILCLGLDSKYNLPVVEVKLHQAKIAGARIITAMCEGSSLERFADLRLPVTPGNETGLIEELAGVLSTENAKVDQNLLKPVEQAADLLAKNACPVILVGPAVFTQPGLLTTINSLVRLSSARVIVLPEQAVLINLLLNIPGKDEAPASMGPQTVYLLGENLEGLPPGEKPYILYQNIYPPAPSLDPDLALPMTAFSEEDGSLIDYAGHGKALRRAVPPPGQALPAWEILCRIARKMGLIGFDFSSAEEIRAEMAGLPGHFLVNGSIDWPKISRPAPSEGEAPDNLMPNGGEETYLGFPLTQYVAGLRQLQPAKVRKSDG